jgi:hypothetical protein
VEGDGGDRGNDTVIIQPVKLVKSLQGLCRYSNVGSIPTKGSQTLWVYTVVTHGV